MFEWLASVAASTVFKLFGDNIVQPLLNAFLKSKDVDLEKFKSANVSTEHLAVAVLDANVRFAQIKSQYALAVLQWWPFRIILFVVMAFCATRFCLVVLDFDLVVAVRLHHQWSAPDRRCLFLVDPADPWRLWQCRDAIPVILRDRQAGRYRDLRCARPSEPLSGRPQPMMRRSVMSWWRQQGARGPASRRCRTIEAPDGEVERGGLVFVGVFIA